MGTIENINISATRGTEKESVLSASILENWGLEGDAHGGDWDRQVSIFPLEAMALVPAEKLEEVKNGGYTENITIKGVPLELLKTGNIIKIGQAVVKIMKIGKDKYKENGRPYIVSRQGRFCRVIKGGAVKVGDEVLILAGEV